MVPLEATPVTSAARVVPLSRAPQHLLGAGVGAGDAREEGRLGVGAPGTDLHPSLHGVDEHLCARASFRGIEAGLGRLALETVVERVNSLAPAGAAWAAIAKLSPRAAAAVRPSRRLGRLMDSFMSASSVVRRCWQ